VAQARVKVVPPAREVRALVHALRTRTDALVIARAHASEWRRLQFDAVSALVTAQRAFVQLHAEIVAVLRSDRDLYGRLRLASLELTLAIDELRELVRAIERTALSD
jgi:hypothetical protein